MCDGSLFAETLNGREWGQQSRCLIDWTLTSKCPAQRLRLDKNASRMDCCIALVISEIGSLAACEPPVFRPQRKCHAGPALSSLCFASASEKKFVAEVFQENETDDSFISVSYCK